MIPSTQRTKHDLRALLVREGFPENKVDRFLKWHGQNLWVWEEFQRLALGAIKEGVKKWSADNILHVIRWDVRTTKGDKFKVTNDWTSIYSRMFTRKYPRFSKFFDQKPVNQKEAA